LTVRRPIVRKRLAALIASSLIATTVPFSAATAEYGIPAGSGAVITAGQPLAVRATPGWDAEVSYEIADGSYVTVWGTEQAAADGSMWYPVDGGFVPVDAVSSVAASDGSFALYQEASPETLTEEWVDPALQGWIDPATGQWVEPVAQGWVDPATGQWVEPAPASEGWVDPTTGQWVEPVAATEEWVDPALGESATLYQEVDPNALATEWVDPAAAPVAEAPASEGWVDPATGQWVEPAPVSDGWVDPTTGQWVEPAPVDGGWVDPATGQWVQAAPANEWVEPATVDVVAEPAPADVWAEPAPANVVSTGGPEPWGEPIAMAYVSGSSGDGAVCRAGADRGADRLAVLGEGEAIEVRGEAVGEWQPVNCAGIGGYVNTSFIAWEPSASSPEFVELEQKRRDRDHNRDNNGNSGTAGVDGTTTTGDTSTTSAPSAPTGGGGDHIANFAMQYVGYPYAYAGEGPYAFDCSGFTKFVVQNTLGMDITHDMFTQIGMGQSVGMSELQPGDLVFFANTFRPGLSHAGIYIGGGQFVHAENESTGVKVSDLNSDYYGSRWAGGTRLA
jgi:cell wall-associated NlpC family hydrolase